MDTNRLTPIEIGRNIIEGIKGTSPKPGVWIITDPVYVAGDEPNEERWVCLANVLGSLCLIEVTPVRREIHG